MDATVQGLQLGLSSEVTFAPVDGPCTGTRELPLGDGIRILFFEFR